MNNSYKHILAVVIVAALLSGCVGNNGVSGLNAGNDAAYLKKKRGSADAQISNEEAEQYKVQRDSTRDEMALEREKRQEQLSGIYDYASMGDSLVNMFRR